MSGEGEWESCCDRLPCGWFTADKTSVIPQRTQVVTGESKNLITLESREGGECVQSVEKTEALRRSGGAVGRRRKTVTCDILKLGRGCRQMTPVVFFPPILFLRLFVSGDDSFRKPPCGLGGRWSGCLKTKVLKT